MESSPPESPEPMPLVAWHRWHWVTWVVTIVVGAAFYHRQCEVQGVVEESTSIVVLGWLLDGWPLVHVEPFSDLDSENARTWLAWDRVTNILFCLALVACTIVCCEWWARSGFRLQFSLGHMLALTGIVCLLLALTHVWQVRYERFSHPFDLDWSLVAWSDFTTPVRWPILAALASALYVLGAGLLAIAKRISPFSGQETA